jgi:hypothetical protein
MNHKEHLEQLKSKRNEIKEFSKKVMLTKMVSDNISDLLPKGFEIKPYGYFSGIKIVPIENINIPVDDFDKFIAKLAKIFGKEPYMNVEETTINATFFLYPSMQNKENSWPNVMVNIRTTNTEACDFVYEEQTHKVVKLTGYCKQLQEKKYLIHHS